MSEVALTRYGVESSCAAFRRPSTSTDRWTVPPRAAQAAKREDDILHKILHEVRGALAAHQFQAVERGVERPLLHREGVAGRVLDPLGHGGAVFEPPAARLENQ